MRNRFFMMIAIVVFLAGLGAPAALAQTGSVKGVCKDQQGNVIAGATVEWTSTETGRKYNLKTNNKGEYFSLGIAPGKYNVRLLKDGAELWHVNNVAVSLDEMDLDLDLKKEQVQSAAKQGMSAEQVKAVQEQQAKAQKENMTVKTLNEKLAASSQASQAGDYDQAITILTEATQMDPSRDLLWFKLGDAYRMSATKQTDAAEKQKRYDSAVQDYQKAIQIKGGDQPPAGAAPGAAPTPAPAASAGSAPGTSGSQQLAAYYNNLAEVYAKSGKVDDAVKSYNQAAQINPANAAQYQFNVGAVLTNAGKVDDAIVAFDKVIAADPTKADAYYWKGVNMIGKATLKGDKMVAPDGTSEAFNKYLELAPTGTYAEPAKQMLSSIGGTVETQFGSKKKTTTKKQ
jgi:tetratricopeptide (TPR) repeat protein